MGARVLVFGEVLWDIFPDGPRLGGAPFNVAAHLHRLGVPVAFLSRIGKDELGERTMRAIETIGLDASWVQQDSERPTGKVQVTPGANGNTFHIESDQAYDYIEPITDEAFLEEIEVMYFGTLARRSATGRAALRTMLSGTSATRFADLNLRGPWFDRELVEETMHHCTVAKISDEELVALAALLGLPRVDGTLGLALELAHRHHLSSITVTQGADGAFVVEPKDQITKAAELPPLENVADTVGAGDAFSAVMILGHLRRWTTPQMMDRANAFARAICEVPGAIPEDDSIHRKFAAEWGLQGH